MGDHVHGTVQTAEEEEKENEQEGTGKKDTKDHLAVLINVKTAEVNM